MQALVLLSGGLDSTVCATLACKRHGKKDAFIPNGDGNVGALSFRYGQKHEDREIQAASDVAAALNIFHRVVEAPFFGRVGALLDPTKSIPQVSYSEIVGVSPTYVPYRNGTLLSIATVEALEWGCSEIWFGAHAEDAAGWAYPDCTPEFTGSQAAAIYVGTYHKVRLIVPLQHLWKKDIVKLGLEIGAPLHLTRSCYTDNELSCGKCPTCLSRLAAFEANGVKDPIQYQEG